MSADAAEPERGAASPEPDTEPTQPGAEPERNAADERDAVLVPRDEDLEHSDRQMWAFKQLIELERQRVDSNNRRTDVAVKAIAASDASDKRQYETTLRSCGRVPSSAKRDMDRPSGLPGRSSPWP